MTRLQTYSHRALVLCRLFFVALPIGIIVFWLTTQTDYDYLSSTGLVQYGIDIQAITHTELSIRTRVLSIVVSIVYSSILLFALKSLTQLFKNYQRGDIFTLKNAQLYQKLGYSVFYWVFGGIVYQAIMTVVLSFNNPPGQRILAITMTGVDILSLLIGFFVIMISWIMQEAYRITDENNNTI